MKHKIIMSAALIISMTGMTGCFFFPAEEELLEPPSEEAFLRAKKYLYGDNIRTFNNVESVAQNLSDAALTGTSAFDYADIAASADYEGMLARLRDFDPDNYALSIINPTED